MNSNAKQVLDDVLQQTKPEVTPGLSDQEYFEVFCASEILKDYDLSYEEIMSGIVDGEHDGGVDGVFSFVNGELITEDFDTSSFKRDVRIEVHVIQSKTAGGFSEAPLNRLISVSKHLLQLSQDYSELSQYNDAVKSQFDCFRAAYRSLAARFPDLRISYYYASKKSDAGVHPNLQKKADELTEEAKRLFPESICEVRFLGANELLALARKRPKDTFDLKVNKDLTAENGYVVLAEIAHYNDFLRGGSDKINIDLFDSNVRDFQGSTEVNEAISNTLDSESDVDFWQMNNGVTVLSSRATLAGGTLSIENPQIVNGLQTSFQIARYFDQKGQEALNPNRKVMVKVVSSEDEETRDKIIKATNSQNAVQPASLRATDKIQRDIESVLKSAGLFYDRRKNYYKNQGKPAEKIVSISLLAQSVMSIILQRPDTARARPSSLIKDKTVYEQVFSEAHPISLYKNAALLIKMIDASLRSRADLRGRDRTNVRFYTLLCLASLITKKDKPSAADLSALDVSKVDPDLVETAADEVLKMYEKLGRTDQIAKGTEFKDELSANIGGLIMIHG